MNLVDQCVQGEGLVQIICEVKEEDNLKKINIVDVLKPPELPEEPQRYKKKSYKISIHSHNKINENRFKITHSIEFYNNKNTLNKIK